MTKLPFDSSPILRVARAREQHKCKAYRRVHHLRVGHASISRVPLESSGRPYIYDQGPRVLHAYVGLWAVAMKGLLNSYIVVFFT